MIISVIVPIYMWREELRKIMELEVEKSDFVEFVFVINGDNNLSKIVRKTISSIRKENREFKVIDLSNNMGASYARNIGLDNCRGDVVLFLDSDVIPREDLLINHLKHYKNKEDVPGILGDVRFFDISNRKIPRAIHYIGFDRPFGNPSNTPVEWGPTANISFRHDFIKNIRFDCNFPKEGGGEDVDFGLRVTKNTKNFIQTDSKAVCYHRMWDGLGRSLSRFFRWGFAEGRLMKKHPERIYLAFPNHFELPLFIGIYYIFLSILLGYSWIIIFFPINWSLIIVIKVIIGKLKEGTCIFNIILKEFFLLTYDVGSFCGRIREHCWRHLFLKKFAYEVFERRDVDSFNNDMKIKLPIYFMGHSLCSIVEIIFINNILKHVIFYGTGGG